MKDGEKHHSVTTLVESGAIRIDRCRCGAIHLTVGEKSIRMCPRVFGMLSQMTLLVAEGVLNEGAGQN